MGQSVSIPGSEHTVTRALVGQHNTQSQDIEMEIIRVSTKILVVVLSLPADGMILTKPSNSGVRNRVGDFNPNFIEYYDYEEPLPQGPTRRPPQLEQENSFRFPDDEEEEYDYYYEEEAPLPQGPTREPPLPSGPTRRPGQATTLNPKQVKPLSPALNQFLNLPLLTTETPRKLVLKPKTNSKSVLKEFGPFESHFIAPPVVNAGALPLAVDNNLPLFPPFNKPTAVVGVEADN